MGKFNWGRVFLGGLFTGAIGFVFFVLATLTSVGREWMTATRAVGGVGPTPTAGDAVYIAVISLVLGIWALWLYAAIRPRYGPGPKTAAVAGLALWVICTVVDVLWWRLLGFIPPSIVLPLAAAMPGIVLAVAAGAWLYKE